MNINDTLEQLGFDQVENLPIWYWGERYGDMGIDIIYLGMNKFYVKIFEDGFFTWHKAKSVDELLDILEDAGFQI